MSNLEAWEKAAKELDGNAKTGIMEAMAVTDEQIGRYARGEMPVVEALTFAVELGGDTAVRDRINDVIAGVEDNEQREKLRHIQRELLQFAQSARAFISPTTRGPDAASSD